MVAALGNDHAWVMEKMIWFEATRSLGGDSREKPRLHSTQMNVSRYEEG